MLVKKRLVIISVVLGTLTLALAGAVGIPSVISIQSYIGKIAEEQGKIDERYALRRYIRNSLASLTETKKTLGTFSAVALQDGKELDFVRTLETAARSTGVEQRLSLETVNQKDISPWEKEIPLKLEAQGQYPAVLAFLNAIERSPYLLNVTGIQIAPPRVGATVRDGDVTAGLTATVYWQAQSAPDFVHGKADEVVIPAD